MEQKNGKSHFGLGFFLGFLSTLVVLAGAGAITGVVLYQKYQLMAAEKEESLFEDYTNAMITPILIQKSGPSVALDYKYATWSQENGPYTLYLYGKATITGVSDLSDFTLEITLPESAYDPLDKNLSKTPDQTKDLAPNYGAIGVYYLVNACSDQGAQYQSLKLGSIVWELS